MFVGILQSQLNVQTARATIKVPNNHLEQVIIGQRRVGPTNNRRAETPD